VTLETYAHLFDELGGGEHTSAEDLIRAARAAKHVRDVSVLCPRPPDAQTAESQNPWKIPKPSAGLEPATPYHDPAC
jgi:hypothetical protein